MSGKKKEPSRKELVDARERFANLINRPKADESDFQALLSECPYVLSRGLPLRLDFAEILPLGRPGREETDFLFYPRKGIVPYYSFGAIELKRPDTQILVGRRKNLIQLSSDAQTAVLQAKKDAEKLERQLLGTRKDVVILESDRHLFAILGLKAELSSKLGTKDLRAQYQSLLPVNTRIIPYDGLLQAYESTIPRKLLIIRPEGKKSNPKAVVMPPEFIARSRTFLASLNSGTLYVEFFVFEHASEYSREMIGELLPTIQDYCKSHRGVSASEPDVTLCLVPVFDVTETALLHRLMNSSKLQFSGRRRKGSFGADVGRLAKSDKLIKSVDVAVMRYPEDGPSVEALFEKAMKLLRRLRTEVFRQESDFDPYEGY